MDMSALIQPPVVYFTIGPFEINQSIVTTWVVMAIMIALSFVMTRRFSWLPQGTQNLAEMLVEGLTGFVVFIMGEKGRKFVPYVGTLIGFILLSNLAGVWSFNLLRPATADVNITLALGIISFVLIQYQAIRSNGLIGYLKGFAAPFILFVPMNVIGELAKPLSLGFRLFGNMLAGLVIVGLIYQVAPILIPVPMHIYFDMFSGILQTLVFSLLTMVFISMAMD